MQYLYGFSTKYYKKQVFLSEKAVRLDYYIGR